MEGSSGFFAVVDESRLATAGRGDLEALEGLYRTFSEPVFTLARRMCRSRSEAEEVLQETFLEMVRSLRSFRGEGAFGAWLRRITISKALLSLRRRNRGGGEAEFTAVDVVNGLEVFPHAEPDGVRRVDLERALARLSDATRIVVWLHDVEGLTHSEIGEVFGRTPSFSKSQLSRAHAKLRSWLGHTEGAGYASESGRVTGIAER